MSLKVPPHNLEAEESILSIAIQWPKYRRLIKDFLTADDFYREAHRHIFQAICDLDTVDIISLCDKLSRDDLLEKSGGQDYISSTAFSATSGSGWKYHADILREHGIRRSIILTASTLAEKSFSIHESIEETISSGKQFFKDIGQGQKQELPSVKKLYNRVYEDLHNSEKEPGLRIGISALDEFYLEPGYIHCVAAESGFGKSAFMLQVADFVAIEYGKTLYFSLESTDIKLGTRQLARNSRVALTRLHKRRINSEGEWEDIQNAIFKLEKSRLILIDNERLQVIERLVSYAESACIDNDVALIVIDFLQLMSSNKRIKGRHHEISEIVKQIKMLSKQLNIPVLFASQLRKDIGGRPKLDDLKESGDIRTHTDNIIFLYAPDSHPAVYPVECFLGKGKDQEYFSHWLEFNGNYQEFTEGLEPEKTDRSNKRHWQDRG